MGKARAAALVEMVETAGPSLLPLDRSVGYQIRTTHRLVQRALQMRIERHGVTLGMWYFLRVLWNEDGLTQSELSQRIGTMEPTTMSAIQAMEKSGFVDRLRNPGDRRKINVYLTKRGRDLERRLMPTALDVVQTATKDMTEREIEMFLALLGAIQENLREDLGEIADRGD
jgi:DNA-binding MarR family transcriptional regulator